MEICLEALNDDELKHLVKQDKQSFLKPIIQRPKFYNQYSMIIGNNKAKNSIVIDKNLPSIATKQYKKNDTNFVEIMNKVAEDRAKTFVDVIDEVLEREVSIDEILAFSNEDLAEIINRFKDNIEKPDIDYDLLWIQMKLVGFKDVDSRKNEILLLCEPITDSVTEEINDVNVDNTNSTQVKNETKPKETSEASTKKNK